MDYLSNNYHHSNESGIYIPESVMLEYAKNHLVVA